MPHTPPIADPTTDLRRNDALDGVRAVAVTAVFLYHARVGWAHGGYLGVSVFFALSGYLITRNLLREVSASGRLDARRFYARRARRLVPASAVAVASAALVAVVRGVPVHVLEVVSALTGWKNWQLLASPSLGDVLVVWWSLAVEEQYYLVYPVVLLALWRFGGRRALAVGLTVAAAVSLGLLMGLTATGHDMQAYYGTHTRLWELLLGCLLALAGRLPRRLRLPASVALAAVLACQTDWWIGRLGDWQAPVRVLVVVIASVALVDALEHGRPGAVHRLLAARPVRWVGAISYEVYLVHTVVLLALPALGGFRPLTVAGTYSLVLVVAALLHAAVRPLRAPSVTGPGSPSPSARTGASAPPR